MTMNNAEIKFYRFLSNKLNLNEDDAETFITLQKEVQASSLATKADIAELKNEMVSQESRLENKITQSSAELKVSLERYRSNILWALLLFWLTQVGVFLGFAYKLFPGL